VLPFLRHARGIDDPDPDRGMTFELHQRVIARDADRILGVPRRARDEMVR
jgi:hypothetical protein